LNSVPNMQRVARNLHERAVRMIAVRTLGALVDCNVAREVMRRKHQYRILLYLGDIARCLERKVRQE
jgi:hypothetical protein